MIWLTPRETNSRNHNFVNKKLNRMTWKPEVDTIDANEYAKCSVPIIHEASNRVTWKPEIYLIESKPPDSIGNNITLTRQSLPDDKSHKSEDERPNENTKHKSTTQESNGIGKNISLHCSGLSTMSYHPYYSKRLRNDTIL